MSLKANTKVGQTTVQIEAETLKNLFRSFEVLGTIPGACSCGNTDLTFGYNKHATKGFEWYFIKCRNPKCGNEFPFGQRKTDGGLFPKGDQWVAPFSRGEGDRTDEHDADADEHDADETEY